MASTKKDCLKFGAKSRPLTAAVLFSKFSKLFQIFLSKNFYIVIIFWLFSGLTKPTPIQTNCIPRILAGDDCIGCAQTGSGKTLAFALPILEKLCQDPYGIFTLVLTPTRELAYQISDQFSILGKCINLRLSVVVGGMDMVVQGQELSKKPHIVVATPGRLADHIESCDTFSLSKIKYLVLDEADRLLGGQFDRQVNWNNTLSASFQLFFLYSKNTI